MTNLKYHPHRTDEEWYRIIMDCRKSGLSDRHFCLANGISNSSFGSAVKRLRKKSFAIPDAVSDDDIYDLTIPAQDVVKVDIVPDIQPPKEVIPIPEVTPHIDNSHTMSFT